jgi:hypothetical protein
MNDIQKKRLDDLARALSDADPERLDSLVRKSERIDIRVTPVEKAEMQATAEALGLSLSEYLSALHRLALPRLARPKPKRRN